METKISIFFQHKLEFLIGLIITFALGLLVQELVKQVRMNADQSPPPDKISQVEWNKAIGIDSNAITPTKWLGYLEQILFYIAFCLYEPTIIAGWLAFKLGSKWQTWQHIIQVPQELENIDPLSYLAARNAWASNVLQRWLIGTLGNIITAFVGVAFAFAISS